VDACPNIQQLQVECGIGINKLSLDNDDETDEAVVGSLNLLSTIRFDQLKWLTIDGLCLRDESTSFPMVSEIFD